MMIHCGLYRFFIGIHDGIATLELQKHYLTELSLRQSIEYDIVTSLAYKYHVLWCVWEVRECGEYLLVYFSEYTTTGSSYRTFSYLSVFAHGDNPHDENTYEESYESSEYECERVHTALEIVDRDGR